MIAEQRKWHFGVLPLTGMGHLLPFIALGQELKARGHAVTFFERPKIEEHILDSGLRFVSVGDRRVPKRDPRPPFSESLLGEIRALRWNVNRVVQDVLCFLRSSPTAISNDGVDVLLVNEIALAGPTIAQALGLPYFIVSTTIPNRLGWGEYRRFGGYRLSSSAFAKLERSLLELSCTRVRGPVRRAIDRQRRSIGFGPLRNMNDDYPCLAHLVQMPEFLDPMRNPLPADVHYTGPFLSHSARPTVGFPWHLIDGRPLIYASLGTTRNVKAEIIRKIAAGCAELDAQLVISLGDRYESSQFCDLPGSPIVTRYAPQLELIGKATAVVTHAGGNSVVEALAAGVPLVAIPLAYDQPAIARRLEQLGVAEVLPVLRLKPERICAAVRKVMTEPRYREAARIAQVKLAENRGSECAAKLIEDLLRDYAVGRRAHYEASVSSTESAPSSSEYCNS